MITITSYSQERALHVNAVPQLAVDDYIRTSDVIYTKLKILVGTTTTYIVLWWTNL